MLVSGTKRPGVIHLFVISTSAEPPSLNIYPREKVSQLGLGLELFHATSSMKGVCLSVPVRCVQLHRPCRHIHVLVLKYVVLYSAQFVGEKAGGCSVQLNCGRRKYLYTPLRSMSVDCLVLNVVTLGIIAIIPVSGFLLALQISTFLMQTLDLLDFPTKGTTSCRKLAKDHQSPYQRTWSCHQDLPFKICTTAAI
jgi:hypothetical protein